MSTSLAQPPPNYNLHPQHCLSQMICSVQLFGLKQHTINNHVPRSKVFWIIIVSTTWWTLFTVQARLIYKYILDVNTWATGYNVFRSYVSIPELQSTMYQEYSDIMCQCLYSLQCIQISWLLHFVMNNNPWNRSSDGL